MSTEPIPGSGATPGNPAPAAPATSTPAAPAPATPPWYAMDGMAADQVAALGETVKTKGWKHPSEALLSYVNLEKVFGADKAGRTILAPKDENDAEGYAAIYDRLGRPKAAEDYKLPVPDGDDGTFAKAMAPVLHKHGLNVKQAQGIANEYNALIKAAEEQFLRTSDEQYKALKTEWGQAATQNEELARRAVAKFGKDAGLDEGGLDRLERAIGTGPMLKLFHAIGASFAEGTFVDGRAGAGGLTPAAAKAEIAKKFSDSEFMARYTNADAKIRQTAIDEMMQLQRIANPQLAAVQE